MADDVKSVQQLEEKLRAQLEQSDLFKDWQSVNKTLSLLKNGYSLNGSETATGNDLVIPQEFSEDLTWREKVLFALGKIKSGFISDIIKELRKHGIKETDDFLNKRISTTASKSKSDGLIGGKKVGKQAKYFLKNK